VDVLARGLRKGDGSMPPSGLTGLVDEAKQAGRLDAAGAVLAEIRPAYGAQPAYHAAIGLLAEEKGDLSAALAGYEGALRMDPVDQLSIERAIALLRNQGREGEARQKLAKALERAGSSIETLNHLAVVCLRQGWPKDAEQIFRKVLASDPGNPGVLANLSASLAQQGRADEAAETLREALRREPDNAQNHYNLGAILAGRGRHAEALRSFQAAYAAGLRGVRVRVAIAKMFFRLGEKDKSALELRQALEIEPGNAEARELLALLGR
jgi:Tfp pilus assembly protein PilF